MLAQLGRPGDPHTDVRPVVKALIADAKQQRLTWAEYSTLYLNTPERFEVLAVLDDEALMRVARNVAKEVARYAQRGTYEYALSVQVLPLLLERLLGHDYDPECGCIACS
jgi:hypothetical protein